MSIDSLKSREERLAVSNFLVLKEADLDVGRFNLFFGPQSSGKSVLAKLLYLFKSLPSDNIRLGHGETDAKKLVSMRLLERFKRYLPDDTWKERSFLINYSWDKYGVSLKKGRAQGSLSVEFSDSWDSVFESLNERIQFPLKSKERGVQRFPTSFSLQGEFAEDSEPECIFIPAVRSLLAHIKRDMPSSVENLSFDPFLLSFWSLFDSCRRMSEADVVGSVPKIVSEIIEGILSGRYINEEDEDWISMKHGKVKLQNASSGQQESLPMFSVLSALPFFDFRGDRQHYFVEEPEAHLFPLAQAAVIKLMAFLYQTANVDFTLTTHSPYIVTALNNHILADTLLREGQKGVSAKVDAIVGKETNVRFEDVRAYTVEGGKIRSVVNQDERLIDGSAVDEASEKIQDDFLSLLDLEG